jgi:hypothetical protein
LGDWKIVREKKNRAWQLFNIANDPIEVRDVAASRRAQNFRTSSRNGRTHFNHEPPGFRATMMRIVGRKQLKFPLSN